MKRECEEESGAAILAVVLGLIFLTPIGWVGLAVFFIGLHFALHG